MNTNKFILNTNKLPKNIKYDKEIEKDILKCVNENKCLNLLTLDKFYHDNIGLDPMVALFILKKFNVQFIEIGSPYGKIKIVESFDSFIKRNKKIENHNMDNAIKINLKNGFISSSYKDLLKHCINQINKYPQLLNKNINKKEKIAKIQQHLKLSLYKGGNNSSLSLYNNKNYYNGEFLAYKNTCKTINKQNTTIELSFD